MPSAMDFGRGRFSPELLEAIRSCLRLRPEDRLGSAAHLLKLLDPDQHGDTLPVQEHEDSGQHRSRARANARGSRWRTSKRMLLAGIAFGTAMAIGALWYGTRTAGSEYPVPWTGDPYVVGDRFRDCNECPEMMVVPAGRFVMGSPESERGREDDEGPQRAIVIRHAFAVGVYELTLAEWEACSWAGDCGQLYPSHEGWGRDSRPVIHVRYSDDHSYIKWISGRTGKTYRLLIEAEWKYVSRAGTTTQFSFGDEISTQDSNYMSLLGGTVEVREYPRNEFGLHDLQGNVWEWVQSCETLSNCWFVYRRGGGWNDAEQSLRSTNRARFLPTRLSQG